MSGLGVAVGVRELEGCRGVDCVFEWGVGEGDEESVQSKNKGKKKSTLTM